MDYKKLFHKEEAFQRETFQKRMEEFGFKNMARMELFLWDLELFLHIQKILGDKIILKGGAATQFYLPRDAQRTSVTGRKIIVDTYGGMARHGGGAFSGKDCTKVDRSASYAARYVAKNIVAAGLANKCEIQLSYAIGVAHPTSIMVDTFGSGKISDESLVEMIRREFDLRPAGIIQMLDLRRPIYKQTAAYGHFGRNDLNLPWERLDKVEELKKYLK